jgi:hypothetical protein
VKQHKVIRKKYEKKNCPRGRAITGESIIGNGIKGKILDLFYLFI